MSAADISLLKGAGAEIAQSRVPLTIVPNFDVLKDHTPRLLTGGKDVVSTLGLEGRPKTLFHRVVMRPTPLMLI